MNSTQTAQAIKGDATLEAILAKLDIIEQKQDAKFEDITDRLDAIEVRLADMDLDTGGGFEIDS